jgi:hypothetical protein
MIMKDHVRNKCLLGFRCRAGSLSHHCLFIWQVHKPQPFSSSQQLSEQSTTGRQQLLQIQHIWADMGYRGRAVDWIKAEPGWTVEIVKRPSKWGRYPIDVEPEPMPKWTTLPRRWSSARSHGLGAIEG